MEIVSYPETLLIECEHTLTCKIKGLCHPISAKPNNRQDSKTRGIVSDSETITLQFTSILVGIQVGFVITEFSPLAAGSCSPILKQ
ncbi:MAG: hypothetical protein ACI9ND_000834 [Yoonia sp.]|jgi:hypothetical protein